MKTFDPGTVVHVAGLGRGVIREARNGRRYLVEIKGPGGCGGRRPAVPGGAAAQARPPAAFHHEASRPRAHDPHAATTIDLHGKTALEAIEALDAFIDAALLAGHPEVRVIHGRGSGTLKAAVLARVKQFRSVRGCRAEPGNPGVTIVML